MSEDNQTCIGLNFTKQNALHCPVNNTKNYFCQAQKAELSENLGYSASGHCVQGVTLDQTTGRTIAKGWYDPMYCESLCLLQCFLWLQRDEFSVSTTNVDQTTHAIAHGTCVRRLCALT